MMRSQPAIRWIPLILTSSLILLSSVSWAQEDVAPPAPPPLEHGVLEHGVSNSHLGAHGGDFCRGNRMHDDGLDRVCPSQDDNLLWFILSLFVIISWGAFVRTVLRITKLNIPYTVILMITGLVLGSGTHFGAAGFCEFWSMFTKIARMPPKIILYTFLPVLIFESAYSLDVHVFMRSLSQILVIALPGMLLSVFLTGFVCYGFMTSYQWSYATSFMFGAIISATDPVAVVAILKELGTSKRLGTLIEGESLTNDGVAVLMFEIFKMIVEGDQNIMLQIVLTLLKIGIGGPAFGLLTGKLCAMTLGMIFNDAATEITITLFTSYLVYWAAEEMGISGVISVAVMALKLSEQETSISPEVKKNVHHFWEMVGYLANTVLFVLVGIIMSETAVGQIDSLDAFNLFFLYANLIILRLAVLMILMPWLTRIGYGLKWQDMMVCMWGGLRGAVGLCLALEVFYNTTFCEIGRDQIGPKFLFHTGGIVFLTLFINGTTTKTMLDTLRLTDVSVGRLQDMNNAIKQVLATRERAILTFRHNRSFTDASWKFVKKYTRILDPYKKQRDKAKALKGIKLSTKSIGTLDSEEGSVITQQTGSFSGSFVYSSHDEDPTNPFDEHGMVRMTSVVMPQPSPRISTMDTMLAEFQQDPETPFSNNTSFLKIQQDKEMEEAEESRQRVIKALKVSFWRQYEKGVLSDVAVQLLIGVADRAGDQELHIIYATDFKKYYELHGFFHWFQTNIVERFRLDAPPVTPKKPKEEWRRPLWWLATREWFSVVITVIVILSLIPAIWEFVLEVRGIAESRKSRVGFLISNTTFTFIYLCEFLIKIIGLGVKGYFRDKWNWVDVFILTVGIVTMSYTMAHVRDEIGTNAGATSGLSLVTRVFRVVKIIRSLRLIKCCVGRGKRFMDNRINYSIFLGYDIGTGFVKAVDDVIKFLPQMVELPRVLRQLESALQTERLETIRLLGLLQQKHPTIAIAVKTRHASRAVLNEMRETVDELRDDGLLDQTEYDVLMTLIESKMKRLWSTPVSVIPNTPETMLRNILWLHAHEDIELTKLILENAILKDFPEGETLCAVGEKPDGVYLIVNGMVRVQFVPTVEIMHAQLSTGELPNVEVFGNMTFSFEDTDFRQVGYLLGEIGILTGLPSACTITCATPITLYHIPQATMKTALETYDSMEDSLESRIWRAVGMRIAAAILPAEPEYQSWTVDRIRVHVEHSAVPIGVQFENMTIPDYVTDIVLLQGEIQDGNSKEVFIAPKLLPRTCKKLSKVPESIVPTRFLVIAEDELVEFDEGEEIDTLSPIRQSVQQSMHQLVVKASRVSWAGSGQDIGVKPSARQRVLLRKIQYEWH